MLEVTEIHKSVDVMPANQNSRKKNLGQYFTSHTIANYMASMIDKFQAPIVRILDAGAGEGILTTSAALRCLELGHRFVHAVLYEIDITVIKRLEINMKELCKIFKENGGEFSFEIYEEDFVLARPDKHKTRFHISCINPPYFKYHTKRSPYAGATSDLYIGNPNIYASFMAVVAACLDHEGQMVAIVPRSFTNGLYFKGFRKYVNRTLSLGKIHIFQSRNQAFKEHAVLQENIICHYTKRNQDQNIKVITSIGDEDLFKSTSKNYSSKLLIDKTSDHEIIRVPETQEDERILQIVELWPNSFEDSGYFISTGRVVEHRSKKFISDPILNAGSAPLLRMHNIKSFRIEWTGKHRKDASFKLIDDHDKYTTNNEPYLILKRFSSKDEKRRLVAGVNSPENFNLRVIALDNHLNYIGKSGQQLELDEAYGLAVLFNSTFMDKYFRCISGNTQVNATEVRLLKIPKREIICKLGEDFLKKINTDQSHIDSIVARYLKI